MRISDIVLLESPQDEVFIRKMTLAVMREIVVRLRKLTLKDMSAVGRLDIGFKMSIFPKNIFGPFYDFCKTIEITLHGHITHYELPSGHSVDNRNATLPKHVGEYSDHNGKHITVHEFVEYTGRGYKLTRQNELIFTLIHEFRHAVDHYNRKQRLESNEPYLLRPFEINSRLSEVLSTIDRTLLRSKRSVTVLSFEEYFYSFEEEAMRKNLVFIFKSNSPEYFAELEKVFTSPDRDYGEYVGNLKRSHLGNFNDPRYRRLVQRVYKHYAYMVRK